MNNKIQRNIMVIVLLVNLFTFLQYCSGNKNKTQRPDLLFNPSLDPVFKASKDKVFLIGSEEAGYQGTAFVVNHKGKNYIVTNFHVICLLKNIFIESENKVAYKRMKVLAVDRQHDVAVLEAPDFPGKIKGLDYSHNFMTSQKIFVVGYPDMRSKENNLNFGMGVISDANYMAPFYMGKGEAKNIQITAPINPGHSGSPVLNERAEVIGVVSWRFSSKSDIQAGNYAIPFHYVSTLFDEIARRQSEPEKNYQEGESCTDDDQCKWLYFCIEGKCQKLRDAGQSCYTNDDCFLPFNCFNNVCSRGGNFGDMCLNDSQCIPPNYCILGICRPLGNKGDTCKYDMDCLQPLLCIAGKCVTHLSEKNEPCTQNADCVSPLACVSGKCQEIAGKTCGSDADCSPLFCILGSCKMLGKENDPCGQTIDCQSGFKCVNGLCKAQPLSQAGGPCNTDYDCQMPLYCISGKCMDATGVNKSTVTGTPCTSDVECMPPLYCILKTCRPLGNNGDSCATDADCNPPLYCIKGVCSYTGSTSQGLSSSVMGTPCNNDDQCIPPLYCILGTCRPLGNSGDPCGYDGDCNLPLVCISGVCSYNQPSSGTGNVQGATCTSDYQCSPPLYCIVGKCRPLGNQGDPCNYDNDCNIQYYCSQGVCTSPQGGSGQSKGASANIGTSCSSDADCTPPLYCIQHSCRMLGKSGESCTIDADCAMPLICKNGKCTHPSEGQGIKGGGSSTTPSEKLECKVNEDCQSKGKGFKYCIQNQCKKKLSREGELCQYETDCQKGLFCIIGTCRKEKNKKGGACQSNDDCDKPLLCKNSICSD